MKTFDGILFFFRAAVFVYLVMYAHLIVVFFGFENSSNNWKAQLKLPPQDTRYRTEVRCKMTSVMECINRVSSMMRYFLSCILSHYFSLYSKLCPLFHTISPHT